MKNRILAALLIILVILTGCNKTAPDNLEEPKNEPLTQEDKIITGTSVLEFSEQYTITAAVMGDVVSANFSEGDFIEKGKLLYSIDKTNIQSEISKARLEVERAELTKKQNLDNIAKQTVTSTATGTITKVNVIKGGSMLAGQAVCEIVDDRTMLLKIPFLVEDISSVNIGQTARISLVGTFFEVDGSVSKILEGHLVSANGSEVKTVEISLTNPGTITPADKATAKIGNISCADVGSFEYNTSEIVSSEGTGKIIDLPVSAGDYVTTGSVIAKMSTENLDNMAKQNEINLKNARLLLDSANNKLKDFTITSPIMGTIISKSVKLHDAISQTNMNNLAVIANLDDIRFKLPVDEMDITKISLDQLVTFTVEAIPDKEFTGWVSYISDTGKVVGDVTLYEVRVKIKNSDELKVGMNVAAKIHTDVFIIKTDGEDIR